MKLGVGIASMGYSVLMDQGTKSEIEDVVDCVAEDTEDLEELRENAQEASRGLEQVRRYFQRHGGGLNNQLTEMILAMSHIINHSNTHH